MIIWAEKCKAATACAYELCGKVIAQGDPAMAAKSREGTMLYHLGCWTKLAEQWLQVTDSLQPRRGRKPLPLDSNQRKERLSILRRYGTNKVRLVKYRQRLEQDPSNVHLRLLTLRMQVTQELLKARIAKLGGVPPSWIEEELAQAAHQHADREPCR